MAETATSIVTTKKEKDPRRVEAGKRLAAISKQAKERKRMEREEKSKKEREAVGIPSTTLMVGLTAAGVITALATLWYTMYPRKRATVEEEPTPEAPEPIPRVPRASGRVTESL